MEDQAEYKTKNRQFHGDYLTPGQGKRPDQYETAMVFFAYAGAAIFGILFFIGAFTAAQWLWNYIIETLLWI